MQPCRNRKPCTSTSAFRQEKASSWQSSVALLAPQHSCGFAGEICVCWEGTESRSRARMVSVCPNHHHKATIKNPKAAQASAKTDPLVATLQRMRHLGSTARPTRPVTMGIYRYMDTHRYRHGSRSVSTLRPTCPAQTRRGRGPLQCPPLAPFGDHPNPQPIAANPTTHLSTHDTAELWLLYTRLS